MTWFKRRESNEASTLDKSDTDPSLEEVNARLSQKIQEQSVVGQRVEAVSKKMKTERLENHFGRIIEISFGLRGT